MIDAVRSLTANNTIQNYIEPVLSLAESYFLKPQELNADHPGLVGLMDEAYLAHRLIEEINDRFMVKTATPLIPVDMTMSNIIVHSLIGEPFANELDEAVGYTLEKVIMQEHLFSGDELSAYLSQRSDIEWDREQHWPQLSDQFIMSLQSMRV